MLTPFGIATRKLRLDRGMRLLDMADKLGLSSAFVSAVETGKSPIPEGYVNQVAQAMALSDDDRRTLQRSADETSPIVRVHNLPAAQREFVAAFARGVDRLPPDLAEKIRTAIFKSGPSEEPFKRRRRGLLVPGVSTKELRGFAETVRNAFIPDHQIEFPVMDVLEFRLGFYFPGFCLDVCSGEELGGEEGLVVAGENCIKLREDVYRRAWAGAGRDRFTACHELAHFLFHCRIVMARMRDDRYKIFRDAEWQADTFAGSLLMSSRHVNQFSGSQDASVRCGMTPMAASVMLSKYEKEAVV